MSTSIRVSFCFCLQLTELLFCVLDGSFDLVVVVVVAVQLVVTEQIVG